MKVSLALMFLLIAPASALGIEFDGEWRVDETATLAQMRLGAGSDTQMARELPTLLRQMGPLAYRFEGNHFVTSLGERSETVEWSLISDDGSDYRVATELRGELVEIRIQMLSLNQMRMSCERDGELQNLIWRRVDGGGAAMDALAMH